MLQKLVTGIIGSRNERIISRFAKTAELIGERESATESYSDDELVEQFSRLRKRHSEDKVPLDDLLVEVFALVREAGKRSLGLRHFDSQLIGGIALHQGNIAEMPTGEGKTLAATLPACLNAIGGNSVHIVTVNDYLAKRDATWMEPLYSLLGLQVSYVISGQDAEEKKRAYQADITYATNNELGFDYLRDNMVLRIEDRVQRELAYAIVDEVDSILIDEARTPLVISGVASDSSQLYQSVDSLIPQLTVQNEETAPGEQTQGDFVVDEKNRGVDLTDTGHERVESLLTSMGILETGSSLYDVSNLPLMHHVQSALRAHMLFHRDDHYIVKDNQVIIIDEHTGRAMPGRRWSDGLHQAVEAKEKVTIQQESQTLASISFQNYFRHYDKLAGMTGTADTEAYEFHEIYALDVIVIPPNKASQRTDNNDRIYLTMKDKYTAILAEITTCSSRGQPILVGTASIESSELLARELDKAKIRYDLLNAKQPEREATIIAEAGRPGKVTIATNMAGRGTDIVLGGNLDIPLAQAQNDKEKERVRAQWQKLHDQVVAAGGLYVIGTERHESRRIDNQLRGRSGRQGDPGASCFYLSLDDELMRIFASDRVKNLMSKIGLAEGEAIDHKMVTNAIERAQKKVEARNFDMRKQLLEYDDVANEQRTVIYHQRTEILELDNLDSTVAAFITDISHQTVYRYMPEGSVHDMWKLDELDETLGREFAIQPFAKQLIEQDDSADEQTVAKKLEKMLQEIYGEKIAPLDNSAQQQIQRQIVLQVLDNQWQGHLRQMDYLRQGVHLRGYAQRNPRQEYKREAFAMFQNLLQQVRINSARILLHVRISEKDNPEEIERRGEQERREHEKRMRYGRNENRVVEKKRETPFVRKETKIGRNQPCPCGSGKKYKHCHGKVA